MRLCYINLFDYELRCAVSGRSIRLVGGYPMNRFFFFVLFVVSFLFSGCIAQPYIYGRTPTDGYNEGFAFGSELFTSRQPAVWPNPLVMKVSPAIKSYAEQAMAPGSQWYSCNGWVYDPDGQAMYYIAQTVSKYYGQYRLNDAPARPAMYGTDGYGRTTNPNPCWHIRPNQ